MVGFIDADEKARVALQERKESVLRVLRTYPDDPDRGMTWLEVCKALGVHVCPGTLVILRMLVHEQKVTCWRGQGMMRYTPA